jgi:hypothetical protein
MLLFKPSEKVLELICSGERSPHIHYNPLISYEVILGQNKGVDGSFLTGLCSRIEEYYRIGLEKERLNTRRVISVFGEAAENCVKHSPTGKEKFTIGLFLGNNGICYGFQDGGLYFKYPEVKEQYENKSEITEFDQFHLVDCCQIGVNAYIYPNTDLIEVDNNEGVLYCVQLKDSIIAPPGENGNDFFYKKLQK